MLLAIQRRQSHVGVCEREQPVLQAGRSAQRRGMSTTQVYRTQVGGEPKWNAIVSPEDRLTEVFQHLLARANMQTSKEIEDGIQTMFQGMVVGTWTAFETLAADLWIAAVNASPQTLAKLAGRPGRIESQQGLQSVEPELAEASEDKGDESQEAEDTGGTTRSVSLAMIYSVTKGSFDLRATMGDLLLESREVKFSSLHGIREAYSRAFPTKAKHARSENLDRILAKTELDALALVRNLLVHKAGVADSVFVKESKRHAAIPKLKKNELLSLDGQQTHVLIDPVISSGVQLIKAVNQWTILTSKSKREVSRAVQ